MADDHAIREESSKLWTTCVTVPQRLIPRVRTLVVLIAGLVGEGKSSLANTLINLLQPEEQVIGYAPTASDHSNMHCTHNKNEYLVQALNFLLLDTKGITIARNIDGSISPNQPDLRKLERDIFSEFRPDSILVVLKATSVRNRDVQFLSTALLFETIRNTQHVSNKNGPILVITGRDLLTPEEISVVNHNANLLTELHYLIENVNMTSQDTPKIAETKLEVRKMLFQILKHGPQQQPEKGLKIVRALYVVKKNPATFLDVTDKVRRIVADTGKLAILPNRYNKALGGDPFKGYPKLFTVVYRIDGREKTLTLEENKACFISSDD